MDLQELISINIKLQEENTFLKEKLKKYTAPSRNKTYYEKHKDDILTKNKSYQVSQEKKKEYARTAYLNKKEKLKNQEKPKEDI